MARLAKDVDRQRIERRRINRQTSKGTSMMYPKHNYVRSQKLLKIVASLDCQCCGESYGIQAAHSNWGGGKGRGIKADDNLVAALCLKCHYEIDQGAHLSKDERKEMWLKAHTATVEALGDRWPTEVPKPLI